MKYVKMHLWALATATIVLAVGNANSATITWNTTGDVTGPSDISLNGTSVGAVNVGGAAQIINGVTFVADGGGNITDGGTTFAMPYNDVGNFNFWDSPDPGGSATYRDALDDARFNPVSPATDVTITLSGLTNGQQYQVQIWYADTRSFATARTSTFTSTNAITLDGDGAPGSQWAIGSFTASGTTQTIVNGPQTGDSFAQLNMIQLRAVPEPGTLGMLLFGGMGLWLVGRRQSR